MENEIRHFPDYKVLTTAELIELTGLSLNTLNRLRHEGKAPPRIKLSDRCYGYPVKGLREWLAQREAA
jgi:predicted DNA-binding transcriptional regulator AlpA